jgi:hypothetical protein
MNFNANFGDPGIMQGKKAALDPGNRFKVSYVQLKKSRIVLCFFKNQRWEMKKYPSHFLDERLHSNF